MPAYCWRPLAAPTGLSCVECLRAAVGRWPPLRIFRKLKADKQCLPLRQFRRHKHRLSGLRSKRLPARAIQLYERWKSLWKSCGNVVENRFAFGRRHWSLLGFHEKVGSFSLCFMGFCDRKSCKKHLKYSRDPLGFRCFLYRYCIASVSCKTIYFQKFFKNHHAVS